jgi:hypothetical protein
MAPLAADARMHGHAALWEELDLYPSPARRHGYSWA